MLAWAENAYTSMYMWGYAADWVGGSAGGARLCPHICGRSFAREKLLKSPAASSLFEEQLVVAKHEKSSGNTDVACAKRDKTMQLFALKLSLKSLKVCNTEQFNKIKEQEEHLNWKKKVLGNWKDRGFLLLI